MRLLLGALLLSVHLVAASPAGTFKDKLDAFMGDTNKAFHDALLKQLQNSRLPVPQTDVELDNLLAAAPVEALNTSTIHVDAGVIGFTLYTTDNLPTDPAPSSTCASALTASINCNSTVSTLGIGTVLDDAELTSVCTSTCTSSLASYRANVVSACKGYAMILDPTTNVSYAPTLTVDYIGGPYNVQCLKDSSTGKFCSDIIDGYDATSGITSLPTAELCSFCTLSILNTTLLSPVLYSSSLETTYDAIAKTCGVAQFNPALVSSPVVSSGSAPFGVNGSSSEVAQCEALGRNITVSAATSCEAVAAANSVSFYDVYISNSLPSTNCTVLANTEVCLPQACKTYTVATNDTCAGIAAASNITSTQLLSYNPNLGSACQSIGSAVGTIVCVSPHGGFPNVSTSDGVGDPNGPATALAPVPTPTASGSTAACGEWAVAVLGDFCSTFALRYGITVADLYTINPVYIQEINANCTNLLAGYYYCVEPYPPLATVTGTTLPPVGVNYSTISVYSYTLPPPVTTGTMATETLTPGGVPAPTNVAPGTRTAACNYYYNISSGDTIESISNISDVSTSDLLTWNPELSTGLPEVGLALCIIFPTGNWTIFPVTPPANVYPNATADCADYYTVETGDTCGIITAAQSIPQALFLELNPGVTCLTIEAGVAYCDFPLTPFAPGEQLSFVSNIKYVC
ncbi:hypothetical protein HMN09_01398100 [Mycena chlorophos]|uniref:LysM domain-containing protein n=1 Tax=Mycena chlorophos TaxID=658473 RepID=A0A8H6VU61_MYCCL|nr:hypothetical protein HMN09_01398100 [Mycena chlorophos]